MPDESPDRRWSIRPFIPIAIAAVTIPLLVWIGTVIASKVRDLLHGEASRLYFLAIAIAGASLLALVYSFVRSLSDEMPNRRWRIRPFIAAAVMVFAIPPIVLWVGGAIEFFREPLNAKFVGPSQLAMGIAGGSVLAIIYGVAHSLAVTMAIVAGTRLLIHMRLDSVWASLLMGAPLGLIVLGTPPVDRELWPHVMIAAGAAAALNWWIVVRPLRLARSAHGQPRRSSPIA